MALGGCCAQRSLPSFLLRAVYSFSRGRIDSDSFSCPGEQDGVRRGGFVADGLGLLGRSCLLLGFRRQLTIVHGQQSRDRDAPVLDRREQRLVPRQVVVQVGGALQQAAAQNNNRESDQRVVSHPSRPSRPWPATRALLVTVRPYELVAVRGRPPARLVHAGLDAIRKAGVWRRTVKDTYRQKQQNGSATA